MITTNQNFPYTEESLTVSFSPRETAASVAAYLALNGVLPTVVTPAGAVVSAPDDYDGDMLIKWVVPQLDDDGNPITQVVDGVTQTVTYVITAPWYKHDAISLDLTIPIGCVLKTLDWLEPELQSIPVRWVTNKGQKYFPITHVDAVIDANGNKISSVIEWCREEVEDYGDRMKSMEKKLLKTVTNFGTLSTDASATEEPGLGYICSNLQTLYIDDQLHIPADPADPDREVVLVDEDGNVLGSYSLPLDYTCEQDAVFYIYSDSPITDGINYSTVTMVARAGGGTNVTFVESNAMLTINDNDNAKTYQVAKANTLVKADGTTIKAVTSADGITKTISVSDDLQGTIYDKTTGALRHKSLTDSNSPVGRNSVAFGDNSQSLNASETALGQYNVSHDNGDASASTTFSADADHTALSLGIGLSNTNRINAVEVMQDGTIYIKGVGNYDGKSITAAGLQSLQQVLSGSATVKCYGPFTDLDDAIDTLGPADQDLLKAGIHFTVTQADGTIKEYIALKDNATTAEVLEIGSGSAIEIDDSLSDTSENPVQNKVINAELDKKYELPATGIPTADLADASVTAAKLAADSVSTASVVNGAITTDKVKDGAITEDKLSGSSVTEAKLATGAVTTGKIAADAIITNKIQDSAVTTAKIKDAAITSDKLADNSVTTASVLNGAITEDKLSDDIKDILDNAGTADGTTLIKDATTNTMSVKDAGITTTKLADGSVTSTKLAPGSVITDSVADQAITTAKIADASVTSAKLANDSVTTASVSNGAITTAKLADSAVTSAKLAAGSVLTDSVGDAAITTTKLADSAVTTAKIKDANITAAKLADDAKVGSLLVTEQATGIKLDIKDAAGTVLGSDTISKATTTLAGVVIVDSALSSTSENPVQNKVLDATIKALKLIETGGADQVLTTLSQEDGLVSATSVAAVTKETTPTVGSAYTYTIANSTTKVEIPQATTTIQGVITLDEQIVENAAGKVTSTNTPTSKALAEYIAEKLGDLAGAMTYQGVIDSTHALPTTYAQGATYVAAEDGTYAGYDLNIGHMLIANGDSDKGGTWTAIKPTPKVENKDVTLSAGTKATIATVDGRDITLTPQTIDSALSNTSENAVQNKVIKAAIDALDLPTVGGTNNIITTLSQEDGLVSATSVAAVTKETTPTTGSAYTYTIAGSATKVEMPTATKATPGMVTVDDALSDTSENPVQNKVINKSMVLVPASSGSGAVRKNLDSSDSSFASSATGKNATSIVGAASGDYSVSMGVGVSASGSSSVASGYYSSASGNSSFAEGTMTQARGESSHAEGSGSIASGTASHAEGVWTSASNAYEHASGRYNKSNNADSATSWVGDDAHTLSSVGIGSAENQRKNALEIMQSGILYLLGVGGYDGTNATDASSEDLAKLLNRIIPVDVSSMFTATPALPSGYTLAQLSTLNLYAVVSGTRYPVTLRYDSTAAAGSQGLFYYTAFDGTQLSVVSSTI